MRRDLLGILLARSFAGCFCLVSIIGAAEPPAIYSVGVAQVDVTPDYPVRLSGFGFRQTESEGVTQPIWAKAMAISRDSNGIPVVMITVDNLGIPASMCDEVARRLAIKVGLTRAGLAIMASHTHTGPMLRGVAPTLFSGPIPEDHWKRIDRYTAALTDQLETVALAAIQDRQPAHLSWGIGSVKFAINRRTKGGPVDHDLPMLVVKSIEGKVRAIHVNYACHCVTLSNNKISGDWAGYAQDLIQREIPSAIALVAIGCGADQNPSSGVTGDKTDIAMQQGAEIATEVKRMLGGFLAPVSGDISAVLNQTTLEFSEPLTKAQWDERAKRNDAVGYHARVQLERLARGEALQTTLNYPIASWSFGKSLAMVFLPGEVVVDYSRRLKRELDGGRLWVNAYSNDAPCYIPSERVLAEGGYEAMDAMYYYDRPGALKAGLEAKIIGVVREQLDRDFPAPFDANKTSGTMPKSPQQSLAMLQTTPNLRVDLVLSEPLIADPVAIDFGLDGSLYVAEMNDYPGGQRPAIASVLQNESVDSVIPSGRIRLVRDTDGDGQFDQSTVFLDNITQPTGVTVWRNGVLVCAAPDILYAEDTDGDDKADVVKTLYSGFGTANNQARLNSLTYGLDGWIYGSCGLFGGTITNFNGTAYELGDRDFRIKPDSGEIEAATGRTQQGRVRDNFGNWFGCDNSNLGFHYPLAEHVLRRNPFVASPANRVNLAQSDNARQLFPMRSDAQRFALSGPPGSVTAACGLGVYHDSQLGPDYVDNLFICEPVNLLVHRMVLNPERSSFVAERPANEMGTEFLRSTDGWFRPVQAITGPDGGLWIVDMYRFIIEDPRWIPEHDRAPLDLRAGSTLGRIYRVMNADDRTPPAVRFTVTKSGSGALNTQAKKLSVFQELELQRLEKMPGMANDLPMEGHEQLWREASIKAEPHQQIVNYRKLAARRLIVADDVWNALNDTDPRIRSFGIQLAEWSPNKKEFVDSVLLMAVDNDSRVRFQAACSLGEWNDVRVGASLARLALRDADDPYLVAAVFSSLTSQHLSSFTTTLFEELTGNEPPSTLMAPFLSTAVGLADEAAVKLALISIAPKSGERPLAWQFNAVTKLVESLSEQSPPETMKAGVTDVIGTMQNEARVMATSETLEEGLRLAAIRLLGRDSSRRSDDVRLLGQLLAPTHPPSVQFAAVEAFERIASDEIPGLLTEHFREVSPAVQPRIVSALLSRNAWHRSLFNAIAEGTIPPNSISAAQRQELMTHPNPEVSQRSKELLTVEFNSDRQQVIQQYRSALEMTGDVGRGRVVFTKSCSQCHKLGEVGHAVGPNLAMVASKTPSFMLQEILDPNRNVDTRYASYVVTTKSGLSRTGILSSESSTSLTLLATEGKEFILLRKEIDELRTTGKSLMPEGMEKDLSRQAVADLIALLSSMPVPSKQLEGNKPTLIESTDGRFALRATTASIYGDQITFEQPFGNIGYWHGLQDYVSWSVHVTKPVELDVYMDGACDSAAAGNKFRLEIGDQALSGQIETTGGWDKYSVRHLGTVSIVEGRHRVVFRPDGQTIRGALVDLRGLHFVPIGAEVPKGEEFSLARTKSSHSAEEIGDVARQILNDDLPAGQREVLAARHSDHAAALIRELTSQLPTEPKEEYRRIPWIWRVAVACGKRDQADQIASLLQVSIPLSDQPLRDWQAVVVGGGIVNGISLNGNWPKPRIDEILHGKSDLKQRWKRSLQLASQMADDESTPMGTRYDALRMIAIEDWPHCRDQLAKYLVKGVHDELQMGAISGLSDVDSSEVSRLLLSHVGDFSDANRNIAIEALNRTDSRRDALLDAIATGRIQQTELSSAQRKSLRASTNQSIRERAIKILMIE